MAFLLPRQEKILFVFPKSQIALFILLDIFSNSVVLGLIFT